MSRKLSLSYVLIPLLYAVIIFGLILLQFSGGKLFNSTIGPISLSAAFSLGGAEESQQVSSVKIQVQGLQFLFDKEHSLKIQNQDKTLIDLGLKSYSTVEKGFSLSFDYGIGVLFHYIDDAKKSVQIDLDIPQNILPLNSVRIPYTTLASSPATLSQGLPGLELSFDGKDYLLSLPPRSFVDDQNNLLVLPGDSSKSLRIAQKSSSEGDIFEDFFSAQVASVSPKDYENTINTFLDSAYNGWRTVRYNSGNGTWSLRDGEGKFNEEILVALLAEAWQRNEYARTFIEMRSTADQHPDKLTYRSSVFLGNLRRMTNEVLVQDRQESTRIHGLIQSQNLDVFLKPDLFKFAVDRGSSGLSADLIAFTESIPLQSVSPTQALGILQNHYLSDLPDDKLDALLNRFDALIKEQILPNILRVDEGYFFQTRPGRADSYYAILAGRVLEKAGQKQGDTRLTALGRGMVLSVLKLADDLGYIPEQVDFTAGAISSMLKSRGPEDFYWMLSANPSYPKEISLNRQLGPGHWFYTVAQINDISIRSNQYKFTLSYPRSRTHYLFFMGLPRIDPLKGMQLFGITWRNAPDFEIYSKGRYYNPDTQSLMIKYFDDSVQEDIIVWY